MVSVARRVLPCKCCTMCMAWLLLGYGVGIDCAIARGVPRGVGVGHKKIKNNIPISYFCIQTGNIANKKTKNK